MNDGLKEALGATSIDNKNALIKQCDICGSDMSFKYKNSLIKAIKNKTKCRSCRSLYISGSKNPMHNKNLLDIWIQKYGIFEAMVKWNKKNAKNKPKKKKNKGNSMLGKTYYQIWVDKYGKEEADKKLIEFKIKKTLASSGKNNPMYGKPSPKGSGNGWSGWYKDFYFRSLKELSYIIKILERFNLEWRSAENVKIPYKFLDNDRVYLPDFLIAGKYLVEIKPKRLWTSPRVSEKTKAAKNYCKKNNLIYKLKDIKPISKELFKKLYFDNQIILIEKYDIMFKERYL